MPTFTPLPSGKIRVQVEGGLKETQGFVGLAIRESEQT